MLVHVCVPVKAFPKHVFAECQDTYVDFECPDTHIDDETVSTDEDPSGSDHVDTDADTATITSSGEQVQATVAQPWCRTLEEVLRTACGLTVSQHRVSRCIGQAMVLLAKGVRPAQTGASAIALYVSLHCVLSFSFFLHC